MYTLGCGASTHDYEEFIGCKVGFRLKFCVILENQK